MDTNHFIFSFDVILCLLKLKESDFLIFSSMPSTTCVSCRGERPAALVRPKTSEPYCKTCFFEAFEREIHETIVNEQLFRPGETIAVAASGGKGDRFELVR